MNRAEKFGRYIQNKRLSQNPPLSQRGLATVTGLSNSTISRIERGLVQTIDIETLIALKDGLQVDYEEIMEAILSGRTN